MTKIKGLIFDVDGVITETSKLHYRAWRDILANYNLTLTLAENAIVKGLPRQATLQAILKNKNLNNHFEQAKIQEIATKKNKYYLQLLDQELKPGDWLPKIDVLLASAKKQGFKLGVASSSFNALKILEKIGLRHYFDFIADPSKTLKGKPAPDIFLQACSGLNLAPEQVIGFEDAIAGVKGLRAANIYTIAITHQEPGNWTIANQVYESTKQLNLEKILKEYYVSSKN